MLKKIKKKQYRKLKNEWNLASNLIEFEKHTKLEFIIVIKKIKTKQN